MSGEGSAGSGGGDGTPGYTIGAGEGTGDVDRGYFDNNQGHQWSSESSHTNISWLGLIGALIGGGVGFAVGGPATAVSGISAGYKAGGAVQRGIDSMGNITTQFAESTPGQETSPTILSGNGTPIESSYNGSGIGAGISSSPSATSVASSPVASLEDVTAEFAKAQRIEEKKKRRSLATILRGSEGILSPAPVGIKTILG